MSHPISITGITCLRDDGSYILEWIAHHLPRGIEHFVILTHDCSDGTPQLLNTLQELGVVTHLPFTCKGKATAQWQALKLAWKQPQIQSSDWALFFDCDEFLWIDPIYPKLQDFVVELTQADAIAIPWRLFGSDGQETRGDDITPRRFLKCAPSDLNFPMGHLIKSLFRPSEFAKLGVHRPKSSATTGPSVWYGPDRVRVTTPFASQEAAISLYGQTQGQHLIGLNHYSLRSRKEFAVKVDRGLPNHMRKAIGVDYWIERNWNTEVNDRILPMLEATDVVFQKLLQNDAVRAAHLKCLKHYEMRADALDLDSQKIRLLWQIGLLSENRLPSQSDARRYIYKQQLARKVLRNE
jgi:hypothetical protein